MNLFDAFLGPYCMPFILVYRQETTNRTHTNTHTHEHSKSECDADWNRGKQICRWLNEMWKLWLAYISIFRMLSSPLSPSLHLWCTLQSPSHITRLLYLNYFRHLHRLFIKLFFSLSLSFSFAFFSLNIISECSRRRQFNVCYWNGVKVLEWINTKSSRIR